MISMCVNLRLIVEMDDKKVCESEVDCLKWMISMCVNLRLIVEMDDKKVCESEVDCLKWMITMCVDLRLSLALFSPSFKHERHGEAVCTDRRLRVCTRHMSPIRRPRLIPTSHGDNPPLMCRRVVMPILIWRCIELCSCWSSG